MANIFIIQRNILMLIELKGNLLALEIAVALKRPGRDWGPVDKHGDRGKLRNSRKGVV